MSSVKSVVADHQPTASAPTGSERSFDCAAQSLRSAQDDGVFLLRTTSPFTIYHPLLTAPHPQGNRI